MRIKKLKITSLTGHFGEVLGIDDRRTHDTPPPSTVIGIVRVLYGEDINNFVFGYTFKSEVKYKDDISIYKHSKDGTVREKNKPKSDCRFIENHAECELLIYTNISNIMTINYMLCMGKSGNPARLHFPIQEIDLIQKEGQGFNQYTPKHIGTGVIKPTNLVTNFDNLLGSYRAQVSHLRLNSKFDYNKNYDNEEQHNIFLWEIKNGEVRVYD